MKKLCFFLATTLLFCSLICSCEKDSEDTDAEIVDRTSVFNDYYSEYNINCWQDIAAIYSAKKDLKDYDYKPLLDNFSKAKTIEDKAGMVISVFLLERQENDMNDYKTDAYKNEIKNAVEKDYESLTVKQLAICFFAMTASHTDFNNEAAAKHLEKRQNKDGGFALSKENTYSDVESSAYALNIITLSKRYISNECYDNVILYLGNSISEKNTLLDKNQKESAAATALTLNSLISAKLPLDGEVSTSLTTAIDTNFKVTYGNALRGYKRYSDDAGISREVTGEVFLCFAATAYGNLWINLFKENNA